MASLQRVSARKFIVRFKGAQRNSAGGLSSGPQPSTRDVDLQKLPLACRSLLHEAESFAYFGVRGLPGAALVSPLREDEPNEVFAVGSHLLPQQRPAHEGPAQTQGQPEGQQRQQLPEKQQKQKLADGKLPRQKRKAQAGHSEGEQEPQRTEDCSQPMHLDQRHTAERQAQQAQRHAAAAEAAAATAAGSGVPLEESGSEPQAKRRKAAAAAALAVGKPPVAKASKRVPAGGAAPAKRRQRQQQLLEKQQQQQAQQHQVKQDQQQAKLIHQQPAKQEQQLQQQQCTTGREKRRIGGELGGDRKPKLLKLMSKHQEQQCTEPQRRAAPEPRRGSEEHNPQPSKLHHDSQQQPAAAAAAAAAAATPAVVPAAPAAAGSSSPEQEAASSRAPAAAAAPPAAADDGSLVPPGLFADARPPGAPSAAAASLAGLSVPQAAPARPAGRGLAAAAPVAPGREALDHLLFEAKGFKHQGDGRFSRNGNVWDVYGLVQYALSAVSYMQYVDALQRAPPGAAAAHDASAPRVAALLGDTATLAGAGAQCCSVARGGPGPGHDLAKQALVLLLERLQAICLMRRLAALQGGLAAAAGRLRSGAVAPGHVQQHRAPPLLPAPVAPAPAAAPAPPLAQKGYWGGGSGGVPTGVRPKVSDDSNLSCQTAPAAALGAAGIGSPRLAPASSDAASAAAAAAAPAARAAEELCAAERAVLDGVCTMLRMTEAMHSNVMRLQQYMESPEVQASAAARQAGVHLAALGTDGGMYSVPQLAAHAKDVVTCIIQLLRGDAGAARRR